MDLLAIARSMLPDHIRRQNAIGLRDRVMKGLVFGIVLAISSSNTLGAVSDWLTVNQIMLGWEVKRVTLRMSGPIPNPSGCGPYVVEAQADENLPNLDHVLALAMAAHTAGREVQLVIADVGCAAGGRPRIKAINIR